MTLTEDRSAAAVARQAMIVSQLRTSGVNEPWVLEAMAAIAREDYVPAALRDAAYIDRAIPLGDGRFLASPLVHARMLSEAAPKQADKALLVGDGEGYLAALLRPLVGTLDVVSPAEAASLAPGAHTLLVIDGAIEVMPEALTASLAEGGRVVTGLIVREVSRLATGRKTAGTLALMPVAELGVPALPEFAAAKRWSF